ncbi:MAG: hypothetical protein COV98_02975 [Candidatus Altarchaeum sp. CG12_big_fil_rev_8_21_14_0_65_33_22]|nr:MAG: hypothetical protein AUK59_00810 [Candidatus Altarchaeum sp. CG2_30_32_3053]PIN67414.1 MAG: hypothetical protein COV98_02975 [Candidatus Altarchaeum sp. CG12_big_fil_rev_8_21_14_0_65_33_22]PIV28410.1 MAG: hypothetical protein COS36_02350 [Candidatus Altarchaeum sp. CG03_land_8_20_14_0_80_32_618]PIZ29299.1 MAG: hypothetical protein COY41_05975 [Candidatus Altarchaeum sp. CG_4_10_14_0_8_um_filter_32_851]PJC15648.1 MAG: hypothetical protein CO063_00890 [Candidatus Altarchaeum sp. CG_4_9_14
MFKTGTRRSCSVLPDCRFSSGLLSVSNISCSLKVSSLFKAEFTLPQMREASAGAFLKSADFKILKPSVSIFKKFWYF